MDFNYVSIALTCMQVFTSKKNSEQFVQKRIFLFTLKLYNTRWLRFCDSFLARMARSKTSHGRIIFMLVKSASFSLIFVFLFFFLSQPIHFTRKFGIGRCCTEKMFLSQHILSAMNHIPRELDMLKRFGLSGSHVSTTPLEATNATFKRRLKYSLFRVNKLLHNLPHNFKNADYLQITSFFLS